MFFGESSMCFGAALAQHHWTMSIGAAHSMFGFHSLDPGVRQVSDRPGWFRCVVTVFTIFVLFSDDKSPACNNNDDPCDGDDCCPSTTQTTFIQVPYWGLYILPTRLPLPQRLNSTSQCFACEYHYRAASASTARDCRSRRTSLVQTSTHSSRLTSFTR